MVKMPSKKVEKKEEMDLGADEIDAEDRHAVDAVRDKVRNDVMVAWDNGYLGFINRASGVKFYTGAVIFNGRQRMTRKRFRRAQQAADYAPRLADRTNQLCNAVMATK